MNIKKYVLLITLIASGFQMIDASLSSSGLSTGDVLKIGIGIPVVFCGTVVAHIAIVGSALSAPEGSINLRPNEQMALVISSAANALAAGCILTKTAAEHLVTPSKPKNWKTIAAVLALWPAGNIGYCLARSRYIQQQNQARLHAVQQRKLALKNGYHTFAEYQKTRDEAQAKIDVVQAQTHLLPFDVLDRIAEHLEVPPLQ